MQETIQIKQHKKPQTIFRSDTDNSFNKQTKFTGTFKDPLML